MVKNLIDDKHWIFLNSNRKLMRSNSNIVLLNETLLNEINTSAFSGRLIITKKNYFNKFYLLKNI